MNYTPRPGSLAAHTCAWFKANPTRKLTLADICGRFGGTAQTATAQLGAAEDNDFLLSERVGRTDVYSAGPKLDSWTPLNDSLVAAAAFTPSPATQAAAPAPATSTAAPAAPTPRPKATRQRLPALDIANIQAKFGQPAQPRHGGPAAKGTTMYSGLFAKLTHPNSWVEVPAAYVPSIQKAAVLHRKQHPTHVLRFVKVSATTHQVQRLADKPSPTGITRGQA